MTALTTEEVDQAHVALSAIRAELPSGVMSDTTQLMIAQVLDQARIQSVLIKEALKIALGHVSSDSDARAWVIDQMVRVLADEGYDALIAEYLAADDQRVWEAGIAP